MNYCSNCGAPLQPEAKFCMRCGSARVASTMPAPEQITPPSQVSPLPPTPIVITVAPQPTRSVIWTRPWLIWLVASLLLALVGGIAAIVLPVWIVYGGHSGNGVVEPTPTSTAVVALTGTGTQTDPYSISSTGDLYATYTSSKPLQTQASSSGRSLPAVTLLSVQEQVVSGVPELVFSLSVKNMQGQIAIVPAATFLALNNDDGFGNNSVNSFDETLNSSTLENPMKLVFPNADFSPNESIAFHLGIDDNGTISYDPIYFSCV